MATLGKRYITFRDINAGRLPDGMLDRQVVELMAKTNPMLEDIPWKVCNRGRENISTVRTGMPEATYRMFYEGVQGSKGGKKQVSNTCANVATAVEIDARLFEDDPDQAGLLLDEAATHASVMGEGVATGLIYGSVKDDPRAINGLAMHYRYLSGASSDQDEADFYVLNGLRASDGSTAMLRSIYLVGWGSHSMHGLYPQGTGVGLRRGKLQDIVADDAQGKRLRLKYQEMNWDFGLNVRDFRCGGRIANIEVDKILSDTAGLVDLVILLRRIMQRARIESTTPCWYMDRLTLEAVDIVLAKKTMSNARTFADVQSGRVDALFGIPVRKTDAMNTNETVVTTAA